MPSALQGCIRLGQRVLAPQPAAGSRDRQEHVPQPDRGRPPQLDLRQQRCQLHHARQGLQPHVWCVSRAMGAAAAFGVSLELLLPWPHVKAHTGIQMLLPILLPAASLGATANAAFMSLMYADIVKSEEPQKAEVRAAGN